MEKAVGPFYGRQVESGRWQLGFRVTRSKLNGMGVCHGGVLATFADIQGTALKRSHDIHVKSPTVNLSLDFIAPAPVGAWVQSEPELVRQTGTLLFFQAMIVADDILCVRASGIYRFVRTSSGT